MSAQKLCRPAPSLIFKFCLALFLTLSLSPRNHSFSQDQKKPDKNHGKVAQRLKQLSGEDDEQRAMAVKALSKRSLESQPKLLTQLIKLAKTNSAARAAAKAQLRLSVVKRLKPLSGRPSAKQVNALHALFPSLNTLEPALKDGLRPRHRSQLRSYAKTAFCKATERALKRYYSAIPKGSKLKVYAATGQEILDNEFESEAWLKFPGGCQRVVRTYFQAETLFFELEWTRPKKKRGFKLHLWFWNGGRWVMVGPLWRVLKTESR